MFSIEQYIWIIIMMQRAFTLIELLVVIGVISLVLAITVPALNNTRQQAKAVVCQSNIAQLNIALQNYEASNGTFPYAFYKIANLKAPPGGYPGDLKYEMGGWWWFNVISDKPETGFNTRSICWCPSRRIDDPSPKKNILVGNYGVNLAICKKASVSKKLIVKPLGINQIRRPSEVLLLCDSGYSSISWLYAKSSLLTSTGNSGQDLAYIPGLVAVDTLIPPRLGTEFDARKGRHLGKTINIGFADGHVERVHSSKVQVEDDNSPLAIWTP